MATDVELLQAWRDGDAKSGEELFDRYFQGVARFFRNKLSEPADDLVQKTFLAMVEGRDRLREDASFRSYLFGVAHNILRKHFDRKRRDGERYDYGTMTAADLAPGASTVIAQHQQQRLMLEGLRRIPLDYQVALELSYWEKMTATEIAHALAIPEGTAKTRIRRARQLLEQALGDLAASNDQLHSTISDLEGWAKSIRELLLDDATS